MQTLKLTGKNFTKKKGGPAMDSQKKTKQVEEIKREPCLICGIRRRREDCLVCLPCSEEAGAVGQLKARVEAENEKAFLADKLGEIVDPWDEVFKFVLEEGSKTVGKKQVELSGFIKLRETKKVELRNQAENEVATKLATLGKGENRALYLALALKCDSLIETRFEELKQDDDFGKVVKKIYGLGKAITSMREQLKGVSEKRTEHLSQVEEGTIEDDEVETVAA